MWRRLCHGKHRDIRIPKPQQHPLPFPREFHPSPCSPSLSLPIPGSSKCPQSGGAKSRTLPLPRPARNWAHSDSGELEHERARVSQGPATLRVTLPNSSFLSGLTGQGQTSSFCHSKHSVPSRSHTFLSLLALLPRPAHGKHSKPLSPPKHHHPIPEGPHGVLSLGAAAVPRLGTARLLAARWAGVTPLRCRSPYLSSRPAPPGSCCC